VLDTVLSPAEDVCIDKYIKTTVIKAQNK